MTVFEDNVMENSYFKQEKKFELKIKHNLKNKNKKSGKHITYRKNSNQISKVFKNNPNSKQVFQLNKLSRIYQTIQKDKIKEEDKSGIYCIQFHITTVTKRM